MTKLFVGRLAWATTDDGLRAAFEEFDVSDAVVLKERETGRSRGFGFVTVAEEKAQDAIAKWHEQELDGRRINVEVAAAREGGSRGGFSRGGDRGFSREGGDRGYSREGGYSRGGDYSRDGGYSRGGDY